MHGTKHGRRKIRTAWRLAAALALAAVVTGGAYAFTASNTVGTAPAGEGESAAVSGYTAGTPTWTLDSTSPDKIQQVVFSLSTVTAATEVYAGADDGTTITWSNLCTQGTITAGSATETCVFGTEPTTASVTKLAVSSAN